MPYTKKQEKLINDWKEEKLKRINILTGGVRSGKTWISLVLWVLWIVESKENEKFIMVGKSLGVLKRNCLDVLIDLVGENNFKYNLNKKEGELYGKKIYLEGAYDKGAEKMIRGLTIKAAYCDELSLYDEDFLKMLLTRLSIKGAKLIATTNPDKKNHWIMENYIKKAKELDILVEEFSIDDNTFLPKEYVESIKREFSGVFYERFILGKWVSAEGLIYREFAEDTNKYLVEEVKGRGGKFRRIKEERNEGEEIRKDRGEKEKEKTKEGRDKGNKGEGKTEDLFYEADEKKPIADDNKGRNGEIEIMFSQVGIDFGGNKSAHAFILTGISKDMKKVVIIDEMYHKGELNPDEIYEAFGVFINRNKRYNITAVFADNAEPVLINGLRAYVTREKLGVVISKAKKGAIKNRIGFYKAIINNNGFFVAQKCVNIINALQEAVWDEKAMADKRLDNFTTNIDSIDAMEYATENMEQVILQRIGAKG